jgi:hypothetical protein
MGAVSDFSVCALSFKFLGQALITVLTKRYEMNRFYLKRDNLVYSMMLQNHTMKPWR